MKRCALAKTNQFLILLIVLFSFQSIAYQLYAQNEMAGNVFVDKRATGNNNGSSWVDAYNSLSEINWANVDATDTIFISGGTDSLVYNGQFTIGRSGQDSTHRLVVTGGYSNGHNGLVVISGNNTNRAMFCNYSYIEFNGIKFKNGHYNTNFISTIDIGNISTERYCVDIINCTIIHPNGAGVKYIGVRGSKFIGNTLNTGVVNTDDDTDGLILQGWNGRGGNMIVSGNTFINRNSNTNSANHKDNIQIQNGWSPQGVTKIYNNFLLMDTRNNNGYCTNIMANSCDGYFEFYNNIMVNTDSMTVGDANSYNLSLRTNHIAGRNIKAKVYNNTLVNKQNARIMPAYFEEVDSLWFKNNLIRGGIFGLYIGIYINYKSIDYNQYYLWSNANIRYLGTSYNLAAWQALSGTTDENSKNSAFTFNNIFGMNAVDYNLTNGSSGIDEGTTIPLFNTEFDGYLRPQGGAWDRGAFEYKESGSILDTIPPKLMISIIIDSSNLVLTFSEALENNSAQDKTNYSINNGIIVNSASLDPDLKKVFLNTTQNSVNQTYEVVVNNVLDLAGNLISPQNNTATYVYQPNSVAVQLNVERVLASVVPEPNHHAEKTLDGKGYYQGDPDSRWAGDTMPEWLVYDLGDVQILNQTKLSFFNWHNGRVYNYSLQVSSDSVNWNELRTNILSSAGEWSIEEIGPIEARYIKIIFIANNQSAWAGLWEAEFYGHPQTPAGYEDNKIMPLEYYLEQNYPNPFNPSTKIKVQLPKSTRMRLVVYNILGEIIKEIANGEYQSGSNEFDFDATGLASGVYVYRIETPDFVDAKKMVLLR